MRFVPFVIISVLLCAAAAVMSVVATAHTVQENTLQPASATKTTVSTVSSDIATLTDMATRLSGPSSTPGDTAKQLETMRKRLATVAQVAAKNTKRVAQARKVTPKGPASNYSKAKQTGTTYYSVRGKNGQFVKKSLVALNGACETSDNEFGFCLSGADCQRRSRRFVSGPCKDGAVCCLRDTPPARTVTPTDQYTPAENQKCMGSNGRAFDGICMTQTDCTAAGVVGLYSVHTPGVQFCKWSKDAKPQDKTKPLLCCQPKREYSAPSPNIKGQKRTKW